MATTVRVFVRFLGRVEVVVVMGGLVVQLAVGEATFGEVVALPGGVQTTPAPLSRLQRLVFFRRLLVPSWQIPVMLPRVQTVFA